MPAKPHMVRIEAETYAALKVMAEKERRSVASLIAIVLDLHIEVNEGWPA